MLGEAGLVHHQHPTRITQLRDDVGAQVVAHRLGVPGVPIEHPLDGPRMGVAHVLRQLPAVLALHLRHQAAQVVRRVPIRLRSVEVAPQPPGGILHLPRTPGRQEFLIHTHTAPRRHATHLSLVSSTSRGTVILTRVVWPQRLRTRAAPRAACSIRPGSTRLRLPPASEHRYRRSSRCSRSIAAIVSRLT